MLQTTAVIPSPPSHNNQPPSQLLSISHSKCTDTCNVNHADRTDIKKEIIFMEEKYDKIKKKLYQKKLLG